MQFYFFLHSWLFSCSDLFYLRFTVFCSDSADYRLLLTNLLLLSIDRRLFIIIFRCGFLFTWDLPISSPPNDSVIVRGLLVPRGCNLVHLLSRGVAILFTSDWYRVVVLLLICCYMGVAILFTSATWFHVVHVGLLNFTCCLLICHVVHLLPRGFHVVHLLPTGCHVVHLLLRGCHIVHLLLLGVIYCHVVAILFTCFHVDVVVMLFTCCHVNVMVFTCCHCCLSVHLLPLLPFCSPAATWVPDCLPAVT